MSAIQALPTPASAISRAHFWPRFFGLALAFLPIASVLYERGVPAWFWIGPAVHAFAWPHLARRLSLRSPDSMDSERRNLLVDNFGAGLWFAAIAFNALPCVLILSLMTMDGIISGGVRHLRRGLLAHASGIALGLLVFGAAWQPVSDMPTVMACLPLLLLHPISIGLITYKTLRKLSSQREELAHLSQHDGLSGLYNRRHWEQQVKAEFARFTRTGQVSTLVLIDLDHFKRVNDLHGHDAGDTVIKRFAEMLRASVRDIDVPGRYGGEEFGILLPQTDPQSATVVMNRLRKRLHEQPLLEDLVITASFGVAGLSRDIENHDAWMRLADQMLYRAKHQGRDRVSMAGENLPTVKSLPKESQLSVSWLLKRDPQTLSRVLSELDNGASAIALFDPADSLVLANATFLALHSARPDARSFADLMRHCHARRCGPRIDTDDIEEWLRVADAKRRAHPYRSFTIEMCDGREFRVDETSFDNGWLLYVSKAASEGPSPPQSDPHLRANAMPEPA